MGRLAAAEEPLGCDDLLTRAVAQTGSACCWWLLIPDVQADLMMQVSLPLVDGGPVDAFCGWFDVTFKGSPEHPAGAAALLWGLLYCYLNLHVL